ncbi:MAG: MFS transporter [Chloroflexota bacterium]
MSNKSDAGFFYGYIIVLAAFLIAIVVEGMIFTFGVFFEPLLKEFGWTRALTAGAFSVSSIVNIPVAIMAGRLTDRFGPRQVLTACGFFFGAGYVLMSRLGTIWQLYLFYTMVGVGLSLYWIPVISLAPRWFVQRRALMMGIIASGIGVGQLIFPPVVNWLVYTYDWRVSMLMAGIVCMVLITGSAQLLRREPEQMGLSPYGTVTEQKEAVAATGKMYSLGQAARTREFWLLSVLFFVWLICLSFVIVHSVIYAIGIGMSPAAAASLLAIIGAMGIVGRLLFGRLSDIFGMKLSLIISQVLMLAAFLFPTLGGGIWHLYLFAILFGLSYGTFEILHSPIIADMFGLRSLGMISGVVVTIGSIGFMVGPVIFGYIFDVNNSYQLALVLTVVMAFIALVFAVILPLKTQPRQPTGVPVKEEKLG